MEKRTAERRARLLAGVLLGLLGLLPAGTPAPAADEIRIGFTPPITGSSAGTGAAQGKAVQLALQEINGAGGVHGKPIKLIVVDNQSTTPGAVAAVTREVEQERVLALISFVMSGQVLATADAIKAPASPPSSAGPTSPSPGRGTPGCSGSGRTTGLRPGPWSGTSQRS